MSFILDALKKSEIDRQRQSAPGLELNIARAGPRIPLWALLLCGLLAVNLLVLAWTLTRNSAPTTDNAALATGTPHLSPQDLPISAPVYAPEIPAIPDSPPKRPTVTHIAKAPQYADNNRDEVLPNISELHLESPGLPDIHLDVHVFATQPTDRFIYVNMRKYKEGATLAEGPIVERIRRDGVVLNYRGMRFLLPRQ